MYELHVRYTLTWYTNVKMTIAEAVAGILDVYLYAQPALGGSGADQSWVVGPVDLPNNPQALGCFFYNAIYANFPSELFHSAALVETVVNFLSTSLVPGYKALGCSTNFPDASGLSSKRYDQWAKTYVGDAKTKAVGSGWYKNA
jgi:hypothetical protein